MAYDTHFLIPFASSLDPACQAAIKTLVLPNLTRFLKRAELVHTDMGDEFDFIPPHERVLSANGIVVTPCHWSVGIDNIRMENPDDLQLTDEESRVLFALVLPYFQEDGIELAYDSPLRWLAQSHMLQGLELAALDRVIGRNVDVWQPPAAQSKSIRRLQNEMQMLLYTHPLNEAREARGLPTVNSFWLSREARFDERFDFSLRENALRSDWLSWARAWQALDQQLAQAAQITLCGERHAATYTNAHSPTLGQRIKRMISSQPSIHQVLQDL